MTIYLSRSRLVHCRLQKSVNINDTQETFQDALLLNTRVQTWHRGHAELNLVDGAVLIGFITVGPLGEIDTDT